MKTLHITIIIILVMGISYVTDKSVMGYGFCCAHTSSEPYTPPLEQFKSGIDLYHIKCNNGMIAVVKYDDNLPLCVKFDHIEKIKARGISLLLNVPDSQPAGLAIEGLNHSYSIGQKIDFKIKFNGTALRCDDPRILVTDSDGVIVWSSNTVVVSCAPADNEGYKQLQRHASDFGDLRINDNSGWHRLVVVFNDKTLTRDFWVDSKETHIVIPNGFSENKTSFQPENVIIKSGMNDTVVWQNDDFIQHQIIADNYSNPDFYDSTHFDPRNNSTIGAGQHFVYYFNTQDYGTFGYHSESGQHGMITILPPDTQRAQLQIQHTPTPFEGHYSNYRISIMKGTKVSWDNIDNMTHTITSSTGVFDSGLIPPRTRFTLDTSTLSPGYYDYFDKLHPKLSGGLRVMIPTTENDIMLVQAAKNLVESQTFMEKYPNALTYVQHGYYDSVVFIVEKQVYPSNPADDGTRDLRLEVTYDPNHNLKNISIVCGGPVSLDASDVVKYLNSESCLKPNS
ncbi:MAG: hypothetical protein PXX83_09390 [Candidatus Nitrosotalea sp.]|nr:hypothetical protein [Candidatus Nitrosotalea sp.]